MMRIALLLIAAPLPAMAAERQVTLGGFERVRVQGPYQLVVAATRAPGATIAGDGAAIEDVDVTLEGGTLTVRGRSGRWQEGAHAVPRTPVVVTVGSDGLTSASVVGGGAIKAARMRGPRVDLAVTGAGAIAVADIQAETVIATVIGSGALTLAGRATSARLLTNGAGTIDAAGLDAGDLTVRLDGPGTTRAAARYSAKVANTGLGQVTVAGNAKCSVVANAGGPVVCGQP